MSTLSNQPFFIVGMQRSGTTLLRLMLNHHSRLAVPFESGFLMPFYQRLAEYGDLTQKSNQQKLLADLAQNEWAIKAEVIQDHAKILAHPINNYADLLNAIFIEYAKVKGKQRWGDKEPSHLIEIDSLWQLFPQSKFIHLVRDGRDVALSYANMSWGSAHLPKVAQRWYWHTFIGHKMGNLLGKHYYLEVRYEDLILNTDTTLQTICDFLGETYEPNMLNYTESAEQEMPEHSMQWHQSSVSQPDKTKVYEWQQKMPLADQIIFDEIAGEGLDLFAYQRVSQSANFATKLRRLYYMLIKRW